MKSLDDVVLWYRDTPTCVTRIVETSGKLCCAHEPNGLLVLNSDGEEISQIHQVSDKFVESTKPNSIVYLDHRRGRCDFVRLNVETGCRETFASAKISGSVQEVASDWHGKYLLVLSEGKNPVIAAFKDHLEFRRYWTRQIRNPSRPRSLFVTESGQVLVGMYDHSLYCVNQGRDGKLDWKVCLPDMVETGAGQNGVLVIGSKAGKTLRALDGVGNEIWHRKIGPVMAVAVKDDAVLAGTENFGGSLSAFSIYSGGPLWKIDMGKHNGIWSMLIRDQVVYLGTGIGGKGKVYALDYNKLK